MVTRRLTRRADYMTETFEAGDKVRVDGERGNRYVVMAYEKDGSVRVWGGSTNPNKWRGVKSVKPERLVKVKK